MLETPGQGSIEALCHAQGWDASQVVKVLLLLARLEDGSEQPVLVCLRGDQELNPVKLTNAVSRLTNQAVLSCQPITADDTARQGLDPLPIGTIGPDLADAMLKGARSWNDSFLRLADSTAVQMNHFHCGANTPDHHRTHCHWDDLGGRPEGMDLRNACAGSAVHNPSPHQEKRGIEVGHIFQLGRNIPRPWKAGSPMRAAGTTLWMGCYGIGISRLAQGPWNRTTTTGICWPAAIAPYEAIVVVANIQDTTRWISRRPLTTPAGSRIDVLLDDRKERAGSSSRRGSHRHPLADRDRP